jgi:UDP-2-acetamido-3-amino-2,3-dideoxy-glucuronate N-acetyltransferase
MLKKLLKFIYPFIPILGLRRQLLRFCGYRIGKGVYVGTKLTISDLSKRKNNIIFKDRVSLGPNVTLITDSSPNNSKLIKLFPLVSGSIIIEEDSWIGASVTILPNVKVGKCSIIATGAVVNADIPPYCIAAGVPAKVIKKIEKSEL